MKEKQLQFINAIVCSTLERLWRRTDEELPEEIRKVFTFQKEMKQWAALSEQVTEYLEQNQNTKCSENKNSLSSIFNHLNGNSENRVWPAGATILTGGISYPENWEKGWSRKDYKVLQQNIAAEISTYRADIEWINVFLNILEDQLFYVPALGGNPEISLYEHMKMVIAVGTCLLNKFGSEGEALDLAVETAIDDQAFLLFSMDVSGIQDFIYTISSTGALKSLRARSFYLEVVMEDIVDELLESVGLCRANLIYAGGGHCYLLLPGDEKTEELVKSRMDQINNWFLQRFQTDLYVGFGTCRCSIKELSNQPEGSYAAVFTTISRQISEKKMRRYTAAQIRMLNAQDKAEGLRECVICKRQDILDEEQHCGLCGNIIRFSGTILKQEYFAIVKTPSPCGLPLPGDKYLIPVEKEPDPSAVRLYRKNQPDKKWYRAEEIFVGDYSARDTLEELADESEGIRRLAIYRADVDNLGNAFVAGFRDHKTGKNNATLARTAVLSKHLSVFFKYYINRVIQGKNAAIVYAGGDDVFVLGAWNDVLQFALEFQDELTKYSQGTLTLSGGIGIYSPSYPIHVMAEEAADLEDRSKQMPQKNAITLFSEDNSYSWNVLRTKVMGEKLKTIEDYFHITENHGSSFLYHLLELIRKIDEKVNLVRYVYLLSRMEPEESDKEKEQKEREAYLEFSRRMYQWIQNDEDRRQLITAIYLYVYQNREKEEKR